MNRIVTVAVVLVAGTPLLGCCVMAAQQAPPAVAQQPVVAKEPLVEPPKVEPPKAEPPKIEPPKAEPPKVESPKVLVVKIGEDLVLGDLTVAIMQVSRSNAIGGRRYGQYSHFKGTYAQLKVKNNSPGKIVDWKGWQSIGKYEDEHGNKFKPISLSGWSGLPNAGTGFSGDWNAGAANGDFGKRINPGETYKNNLYFQFVPDTSKEIIMRFRHEKAVIEVRGMMR